MKSSAIAIVGMAGRFPGAENLARFWENLRTGVESISDRTNDELLAAGVTIEELSSPGYVKRASILNDVAMFDASFFGFSPRDASIMDPQHRHFLECAWEALEDAGRPPRTFKGSIGVFAGSGMNTYLIHNLLANRRLLRDSGLFQLKQTGNDKDVLATRLSYQLDLRGPSINVQTACSTSLVAVHLACQSLLNFECDMALAGGVTIEIPHGAGYLHKEGEILSRDGHCRSFDAASSGTVFASGLGIIVLRRLEDALESGDQIRAVVLGSAINNDGARKVGYLAPSVEGQSEVIGEALAFAAVTADEISYVETHGTGTIVGDPIEVRALSVAFRATTQRKGFCAIGSLKSNVGHLDAAAGVAGLIKTVLALEHEEMPPSLHFDNPNPHIKFDESPFFVNNRLREWHRGNLPRRAGVTSLGIGGTNAHVIVEEAPVPVLQRVQKPFRLLVASAKSESIAQRNLTNLCAYLEDHRGEDVGDVAYTSQVGRMAFQWRQAVVLHDDPEKRGFAARSAKLRTIAGIASATTPEIVFMFSGQGSQYPNMARDLYEEEPVFREALSECADHLRAPLGLDLIEVMYPKDAESGSQAEVLNQTWLTQPALFSIEYALARWWMSIGIRPSAMVGHSLGEYVAACISGVFTLQDALSLVVDRGRLIYDLPAGAMLAVALPPNEIPVTGSLSLAAVNNPRMCVISGPFDEIAALESKLAQGSVNSRRLHTSHAFHSSMMDPILDTFEGRIREAKLNPPTIPYLSNITGTWVKTEEATDPSYWAKHIRQTVRFSDCLSELLQEPSRLFIEVGPGNVLTGLAHNQGGASTRAFQSLPHPHESITGLENVLQTLGELWVRGSDVNWETLYPRNSVRRLSLPTYAFERQRYWIEPDKTGSEPVSVVSAKESTDYLEDGWFYRRIWKPLEPAAAQTQPPGCWILFRDSLGLSDQIAHKLTASKTEFILVDTGTSFKQSKRSRFSIRPGVRADYDELIAQIIKDGFAPRKILHLWSMISESASMPVDEILDRSFLSSLYLAQALGAQDISDLDIAFITNGLQKVEQERVAHPERAVIFGPARVIPKEMPGIACRSIDVELNRESTPDCAAKIVGEMASSGSNATIAYRHGTLFVEEPDRLTLGTLPERIRLEHGGIYLITGGLGGIGLEVALHLARQYAANLVLIGRSQLPDESKWQDAIAEGEVSEEVREKLQRLIQIRGTAGALIVKRADVTNADQMRIIVQQVTEIFGRIDGVFHAAGLLDDGALMFKTAESAKRVIDPKLRGTLVLDEVLRSSDLKFFVLFSSISSIFPPPGQIDYAAANAFLDAYGVAHSNRITVVNWDAWQEVGMAAKAASPHTLLKERLLDTSREIAYASKFSIARQWLLSEHRLKNGMALVPGTGYLEMVAAAFSRGTIHSPFEFRDVFFLAPLTFVDAEVKDVHVQLMREAADGVAKGSYRFKVLAHNKTWIEHATGSLSPCLTRPESWMERSAIIDRCRERQIDFDDNRRTKQERYFDFGPRWHCLRTLWIGEQEGLAELEIDARFMEDTENFSMHPALLDLATGCSLYLTDGYESSKDLYLPLSYKRIRLFERFPGRIFSYIRARSDNHLHGELETFDITLFDSEDRVIAEIEGFSMRRIADPENGIIENPEARLPLASDSVDHSLERPGIPPEVGVRALTTILLNEMPPNVLFLRGDPAEFGMRSQIATLSRVASPIPSKATIEATLGEWWKELLGVEAVELDDDFFGLGGHSLVGIRLFAKIKKTYQTDLELGLLFEARTVRQLAALIRQKQEPETAKARSWSSLIPIQPNGSRVPIFCVHAIGGDVLFYEKLAKSLGPSQPFYAFRSPLVTQPGAKETSIEELASLYVKEMRTFLPEGPYLLGGLSFGGLVAFEMAHQLRAQGVEPGLVVLFDTSVPGSVKNVEASDQFKTFWQQLRKQGIGYLAQKAAVKKNYWARILREWSQAATCSWYQVTHKDMPADLRYFQVQETHRRALARYVFREYPGKVTLMRAVDRGHGELEILSKREDPALGWTDLAGGGLEIHDVPAGHSSMLLEPWVRTVAEMLKTILPARETNVPHRQPAA